MSEDLNKSEQEPEQEEAVDPIALLAERLGAIESALGIGTSQPNESNLLGRLSSIETSLTKDLRERNLPICHRASPKPKLLIPLSSPCFDEEGVFSCK